MTNFLVHLSTVLRHFFMREWNLSEDLAGWVLFACITAIVGSTHLIFHRWVHRPESESFFKSKSFLRVKDVFTAAYPPLSLIFWTSGIAIALF
jgi:hypothetical protein